MQIFNFLFLGCKMGVNVVLIFPHPFTAVFVPLHPTTASSHSYFLYYNFLSSNFPASANNSPLCFIFLSHGRLAVFFCSLHSNFSLFLCSLLLYSFCQCESFPTCLQNLQAEALHCQILARCGNRAMNGLRFLKFTCTYFAVLLCHCKQVAGGGH